MQPHVCVIGGGAAGFFAAINCAISAPHLRVSLIEGAARPLTKVKVSGGGRCNVTNSCTDPADVVKNYPRGERELRGPMTKFGPRQTVEWFAARGVELRAEMDGRVFPATNTSQTIIECLQMQAAEANVHVQLSTPVDGITLEDGRYLVATRKKGIIEADGVILATGSSPIGYNVASGFGHQVVEPVPSLFTFNIDDPRLTDLQGIAFDRVELRMATGVGGRERFEFAGPLLVTHWGLSGPAVLKLSAFGARALHDAGYVGELTINFCPSLSLAYILNRLAGLRKDAAKQRFDSINPFNLPKRFWSKILLAAEVPNTDFCSQLTNVQLRKIAAELKQGSYLISGKGMFKEEFVTAGGVSLAEVNFQTMESKKVPRLFFAGEILDIDGITGGFNFQNAWTTGWLAAGGIAQALERSTTS